LSKQAIGAFKGVTESTFRKANAMLGKAVDDAHPQEALRTKVAERARDLRSHPIIVVKKPFPPGQEEEFSRMATVMAATLAWVPDGQTREYYLKSQGVDTILEIQLLNPALSGEGIINPPMTFSIEVRTSLRRVQDPERLYSFTLKYRSTGRKFADWAANDAQPFREELERCSQTVAAKIVEQLAIPAWRKRGRFSWLKGRGE
jgi:hypothetical protein